MTLAYLMNHTTFVGAWQSRPYASWSEQERVDWLYRFQVMNTIRFLFGSPVK